ncbi:glutathione S-transferase C-terminal domain-containing protein homolog [Tigriopus californicus]|nr:glutathione S-transferase C-terminal domain-containing protein homolog [Tigriopus californicus]
MKPRPDINNGRPADQFCSYDIGPASLQLFIEVGPSEIGDGAVSPQTLALFSALEFAACQGQFELHLVETSSGASNCVVPIRVEEHYHPTRYPSKADVPQMVRYCVLPAIYVEGKNICITGLCSVVRFLVKRAETRVDLLGYQGNCLSAPAEVSTWTAFCEIGLPGALEQLLKDFPTPNGTTQRQRPNVYLLPLELAKFEVHLHQPVRVHNIRKRMQTQLTKKSHKDGNVGDEKSSSGVVELVLDPGCSQITKAVFVERGCEKVLDSKSGQIIDAIQEFAQNQHIFAEGPDPLLSDVLLFPYFWLMRKLISDLLEIVPSTKSWFHRLQDELHLNEIVDRLVAGDPISTTVEEPSESSISIGTKKMVVPTDKKASSSGQTKNEESELKLMVIDGIDFILPPTKLVSLYKSDPSRQNPNAKIFTRQQDIDRIFNWFSEHANGDDLILRQPRHTLTDTIHESVSTPPPSRAENDGNSDKKSNKIDWSSLPHLVHPMGGMLPEKRLLKKCQQLENLASAVLDVVARERAEWSKNGQREAMTSTAFDFSQSSSHHTQSEGCHRDRQWPIIVDFCSGGGHLGILLAFLLPRAQIYLVENKEESLRRAFERVDKLGLSNVGFFQCNLDYFSGGFDIGVSLHACGVATDLVLKACLDNQAHFVCCPCCYGSVQENHILTYPKSLAFQEMSWNFRDYLVLGHTADQTHVNHEKTLQGFRAMDIVDSDRALEAIERGYQVQLTTLWPPSCTPKNNLLVGTWKPAETNQRGILNE